MNSVPSESFSLNHKNFKKIENENVTDVKEVILSVNSSPLILNIQSSLCSPSSHINQQRLSCSGPVCRICHEGNHEIRRKSYRQQTKDLFNHISSFLIDNLMEFALKKTAGNSLTEISNGLNEELVSPCMCTGTLGLVHTTCIEKWLSSSNTTSCEICKYQYNLLRRPKSLFQWLRTRSPLNGPSGFCGDVFCLVLLTPLCIGSVYLCAIGARAYIKHGLWEGTGLAMLCCFLMAVYILWCFVAVRFHWKRFRKWQSTNKTVHLIDRFCSVKECSNKISLVDLSQPYIIT